MTWYDPVAGSLAICSLRKRGVVIVREVPVPDDLVRLLCARPAPTGGSGPDGAADRLALRQGPHGCQRRRRPA